MFPHSKPMSRLVLAALAAAAGMACKSDGTAAETGTIVVALNPTSASVAQGGSTVVIATLTRSGGFDGAVQFGVTGNPTGVTGAVSNEITNGVVTTATITVSVAATVAAGVYPLVVSGSGSGVTTATVNFTLTVTAPATYAISLTLENRCGSHDCRAQRRFSRSPLPISLLRRPVIHSTG